MIAPDPALAGPRPAATPRETARKAGPQGRSGDDFDSVLKEKPAAEKRAAGTKESEVAKPEAGRPEPAKSEGAGPDDPTNPAATVEPALPMPELAAAPVAFVAAAPAAPAVAPPVAAGDPMLTTSASTFPPPMAAELPEPRETTPGAGQTSREDPPAMGGVEPLPSRGSTSVTKPAATSRVPEDVGPQMVPERDVELQPAVPPRETAAAEPGSRAPAAATRIAATTGGDIGVQGPTYRDAAPPAWHLAADPGIAPVRSERPALPQTQPQTQLHPLAMQPQAVVAQVAVGIGRASDDRLEIRLDPPELGRVQIHLTRHDGAIQAVVLADRPETQDLLRRHAEVLTRELGQAGYDSVSLDFAGGRAWPGREDAGMEWAQAAPEAAPATAPATDAPAVAPPRGGLAGGLDIRL